MNSYTIKNIKDMTVSYLNPDNSSCYWVTYVQTPKGYYKKIYVSYLTNNIGKSVTYKNNIQEES